jgi:hypothetical protein
MKKAIFSCLILLSISANAQDSKFFMGLTTAGVWNSYLLAKKSEPFELTGKLNVSGGLQAKYLLNKKISIDGQLIFSTKNFGSGRDLSYYQLSDPNDPVYTSGSSLQFSVKQNYLEVPVSVNYFFPAKKSVTFFGTLGITNSFLLSAKYKGAGPNQYFSTTNGEVFERYKSYLLSVKAGAGVLFPMGRNFYGSVETYSNIYPLRVHPTIESNPFQLALGFSVL